METVRIFETSKPAFIRDLFKVLQVVNGEMDLRFTPEGFSALSMDASHVALVDFALPDSAFERYAVYEPFTVGLNLEDVEKALKKIAKRDRSLTLEYSYETVEDEETGIQKKTSEKITFILKSDIERRKTLSALEPSEMEVPIPKLWFDTETRMILPVLKRILDDFKGADQVEIAATDEGITFSVSSDGMEEMTPLKRRNDNILSHRAADNETRAFFVLSYLGDFVRAASKVSEVATVELKTDMPLKLSVELPQGHLIYYQGPMIWA